MRLNWRATDTSIQSSQWLNLALHCTAVPPISHDDFLCAHGMVPPSRAANLENLVYTV